MSFSAVPGYAQGYRFDQDPAHYDAVGKRFLDLAGYGAVNDLVVTAGAPTFSSASGFEGWVMDNTCHGESIPAIPWEGTWVLFGKTGFTANASVYPVVFGSAASIASNGRVQIQRATAADIRWRLATPSSVLSFGPTKASEASIVGCAWQLKQSSRTGKHSEDGAAPTETAAVADAANGNGIALGYHAATAPNVLMARWGNLSGTIGDVVASVHPFTILSAHQFLGHPMDDAAVVFQAAMAAERTAFGL